MVMVRRGGVSVIRSPGDPDQVLADAGPDQTPPDWATEAASWPWDLPALNAAVLQSQRRRTLVAASLRQGARTSWDWQPPRDAGIAYVREHMELNDIEAMAQVPPRRLSPPQPRQEWPRKTGNSVPRSVSGGRAVSVSNWPP